MAVAVDKSRAQLCNLLGYAEENLKMGDRVVSDLSKNSLFSFYEHDVTNFDGLDAPAGDVLWLLVSRLHEIDAPNVEPIYQSWLRMVYDNLKAVVETIFTGKERLFNRRFMVLANHYLFEPVACTPASGWGWAEPWPKAA